MIISMDIEGYLIHTACRDLCTFMDALRACGRSTIDRKHRKHSLVLYDNAIFYVQS